MPKKLKLISGVCLSVNIMAVFLLVYILLEGSGKGGESPYIKDLTSETYLIPRETGQSMGQSVGESVGENNTEESIEETDIRPPGLEDYLVCMNGVRYSGSGGNSMEIYVQEEGGSLKEVLSITDRLHVDDGIHARFTVLDEKTDGYYAIVLTTNHILRYDKDTGKYEFHDGE